MVTFLAGRTLNMGEGGGGGAQEHDFSQIVQPIVRIIIQGVKLSDARNCNLPNNF